MAATASKQTGGVRMRLVAYHNCDDVELFWRVTVGGEDDAAIAGVLGFMVERQRRRTDGSWGHTEVVRNRVGFSDDPETSPEEHDGPPSKPSKLWPFQCYDWTDHGANNGQTVRYRVSAMKLPDGGTAGTTPLVAVADTDWTEAIAVSTGSGGVSAYFNRGQVMSQYVARVARMNGWSRAKSKGTSRRSRNPSAASCRASFAPRCCACSTR
jgi:hypothetical protein